MTKKYYPDYTEVESDFQEWKKEEEIAFLFLMIV